MKEFESIIIGGGITGLTAAYELKKKGGSTALVDGAAFGGVIRTATKDGFTMERGPNVLVLKPALLQLLRELNLVSELAEPKTDRYRQMVFYDGRPVNVPKGLLPFIKSPLLKASSKLKAARALLFGVKLAFAEDDKSVSDFFSEAFGADTVQNLLDPVLQGIYGGDTGKLSARSLFPGLWDAAASGEPLRNLLKGRAGAAKIGVLRGGNSKLVDALKEAIGDRTQFINENGVNLEKSSGIFSLQLESGRAISARKAYVATSGRHSARFLAGLLPELSTALLNLSRASLTVVHFRSAQLPDEFSQAFGVLFPSSLNLPLLGVMFNSELFPHVAPSGKSLITVCLGGIRFPEFHLQSDDQIITYAQNELNLKLGLNSLAPLEITRWQEVIPQYNVGQARHEQLFREAENAIQGLHFIGSDHRGVGVADRVAASVSTVM